MLNLVIPTEKPLGFDEESTVCTTQSSRTQSTHWRSSRRSFHSLLRMTGFNGLMDQLRITRLGLSFPQTCHSDRSNEESDEESTVYTSQSSRTRITHWRSSRRFAPQDDTFGRLLVPQPPSFRQRNR